MTLRDVWLAKGKNSAEVAVAAKCSVATLYKLNRREDSNVAFGIVKSVCNVLNLTLNEYDALIPCPKSGRYIEAEKEP